MHNITRRDFLKLAGYTTAGVALAPLLSGCAGKTAGTAPAAAAAKNKAASTAEDKAKVYYTKHIDADHLIRLYQQINANITGKVAIKLHTGEKNGPYILPRELVRAFQAQVPNSAIVETNTLYDGDRYTTAGHRETLKVNGWTFCPVDILDEDGGVDLPVKNGKHLKFVTMGSHITNYDSMIVLTHFKGHTMGGYGGSMKNIAIGCASGQVGKKQVHGLWESPEEKWVKGEHFMELMADSAKATVDYFGQHIVFINIMRAMSVDCDCAGLRAAPPTLPDLGIMASTSLVAVDQASIDLIYKQPQNQAMVERIESRSGLHQLTAMRNLGMGSGAYELLSID